MIRTRNIIIGLILLLGSAPLAIAVSGYSDVSNEHENARPIGYLKSSGIMTGYPDGTFRPDQPLNRAELVKIIVETNFTEQAVNLCDPNHILYYSDVDRSAWYANYLCVATQHDIVGGYPDGTFRPANTVNIVEALKILANARNYRPQQNTEQFFFGHLYHEINPTAWYAPYVQIAEERSIADLFGEALDALVTRKRIAEYIYRSLLSDIDVSFSLLTATSCQLRSLNTVMIDTTYVKEGGNIVDIRQTLRARGNRECLIGYDINPYSQVASSHFPTMLIPLAFSTTEDMGDIERTTIPAIQNTAYFKSGYPSGEATDHIWEFNLATGILRMVADDVNTQAAIISPDQTFALYADKYGKNLYLLNLRSGVKKLIETVEAPLYYQEGAYALSPNGKITYTVLNTSNGIAQQHSTTLSQLFAI